MPESQVDKIGRSRRYYGRKGTRHWTQELIIEKAQEWRERYKESPRASDWDVTRMQMLATAMQTKAREWEMRITTFKLGDYPARRTVNEAFGSWNTIIEAAGLPTRAPSQNTPRGIDPSPLLMPLGHAINRVYEAEDLEDHDGLIAALKQVESICRSLRRQLEKENP